MNNRQIQIFQQSDGQWVTGQDFIDKLYEIGAGDCDTLFVQTDIVFGRLNKDIKRRQLLQILSDILLSLEVKTLVLPTFTYSFPNHQVFDVVNSKTSMGVLLEYMRNLPQVTYRTEDPLLSLTIIGENASGFNGLAHNSLGPGSAFDHLHSMPNVKFLMFGGEFGESFTYVHHVEKILEVPYRYDQYFTGTIINANGESRVEDWSIHTACKGVLPRNFYDFEDDLVEKGYMKRAKVGDGKIVCVSECDVYREIINKIKNNPCYFLERPYAEEDLVHEYKYGKNGEMVTHC